MIELRSDQMEVFDSLMRVSFVRRVVDYLREAHGAALPEMPEEQLRERVKRQIATAAGFGVKTEAAVVQFIELSFAFGDDFHSSTQYPAAERILSTKADGVRKMEDLLVAAESGFTA